MKIHIAIFFLLFGFFLPLHAEWQRNIANYSRRTYASGSQNWKIRQHPNGWMYFANNKGLLEFDGSTWNSYSMDGYKTRAICISNDTCIYIGGMSQFGYFTPNRLGGLDYHCLSDLLPRNTSINVIWDIHSAENRTYFFSNGAIYCAEGNAIHTIHAPNAIQQSALINGKLYVADEKELYVINGNRIRTLPQTQSIAAFKVVALLPFKDQVMIVTRDKGLYVYDGHTLAPYKTAADRFIANNHLFCAAIKGDTLALGSIQEGVLLVYLSQNRTEHLSTGNGLQNNTVLSMAFDDNSNLWLGLDNGIDCIRLNSPVFSLYGNKPVLGSGYASCVYQGKLYLGTNQGLYAADLNTSPNANLHIRRIEQVGGQVWNLSIHGGQMFCCADVGIFVFSPEGIHRIKGIRGVWSVAGLSRPDRLLAGTYSGLYLLKKEKGKWETDCQIEGYSYSCKNIDVENDHTVWAANKGDGLYRLTLSDDLKQVIKATNCNSPDIPKDQGVFFLRTDNQPVIGNSNGLFKYNPKNGKLESFEKLEKRLKGKKGFRLVYQAPDQSLWFVRGNDLYLASEEENGLLLRNALVEGFPHINKLDSNHLLAGTEDGFTLLHVPYKEMPSRPLHLQVRKVFFTGIRDSLAYGRSFRYDKRPLVIPYGNNSIRIVCSADNYLCSDHNFYSYRLTGKEDTPWSEYSENNMKEYTDLREGTYTFQARLLEKGTSEETVAAFTFTILPPWYRSWAMYGVYALLSAGILYLSYRYASRKQQAIIQRQQCELERQEREFEKETQLKDQRIVSLEEENLQAELKHKTDELVRTTLNIVRKNEILQDIKKEALNISKAVKEENLVNIRRSTLRLIGNIDTNLEHDDDIQTFETAFDSVHHDFFKRLDHRYPNLNQKEKMMCAYIKMNLMSKEIAPLLNISLRGVEIARYRLRKKLGLEEGENLAGFLQKLDDN